MMELDELIKAIEAGDNAKVEQTLQANPPLQRARHTNGVSLLLWALYYGQPGLANQLAHGRDDLDIFEAAALGLVGRLEELLKRDGDLVNAWSVDGFQPLGLACFFRQPAAARLLIEAGAAVDSPSKNGARVMPLHSAAAAGQVEIVRWLLRHGAPVNARQAGNFTALHSAAQNGQLEMLDLLLVYGADLELHNTKGETPMDFALQGGHTALVERLQAARTSRRVILRPSDPTWPVQFRAEAASLLSIFEPLLGAIYHIGSTSVAGLLAKPTLDILIDVTDLSAVDQLNQPLADLGFVAKGENGITGRRYFVRKENGKHLVHVHVFQSGNPEIKRHLAFRDYLRSHPEMAAAYGELKEELALQFVLDPESYTDGKEKFVREMDRLAAEEGIIS